MHVGKYSGLHYTALLIPAGLHHTDWVGTLHAHVDENGRLGHPRRTRSTARARS